MIVNVRLLTSCNQLLTELETRPELRQLAARTMNETRAAFGPSPADEFRTALEALKETAINE